MDDKSSVVEGPVNGSVVVKQRKKPGPKTRYTPEVFTRICERFGMGMPLKLACAAEGVAHVNDQGFEIFLAKHRELLPQYKAAKGKYLEWAMQKLARNKDWRAVAWHLERRHSDLYAPPLSSSVTVNQSNTNAVAVIPAQVRERAKVFYEERHGQIE